MRYGKSSESAATLDLVEGWILPPCNLCSRPQSREAGTRSASKLPISLCEVEVGSSNRSKRLVRFVIPARAAIVLVVPMAVVGGTGEHLK